MEAREHHMKEEQLVIESDDEEDIEMSNEHSKNNECNEAILQELAHRIKIKKENQIQELIISDEDLKKFYSFKKEIGKGSFGTVFLAVDRQSNHKRAIKIIKKRKIKNVKTVISEIESLKKLDHPNLVKLIDLFQTDKRIVLVQEYMEGADLFTRYKQILDNGTMIDEQFIRMIFKQVLSAISYIHDHRICHRDIKLENFVFQNQSNNLLKMIDFGLSSQFIPQEERGIFARTISP